MPDSSQKSMIKKKYGSGFPYPKTMFLKKACQKLLCRKIESSVISSDGYFSRIFPISLQYTGSKERETDVNRGQRNKDDTQVKLHLYFHCR